jgi:transcriptional/translational regulatory protein YebC/TACO1
MVTMCVKAGGPDLIANQQLGKLMDQARKAGVPVSNMEAIIKRASTSKDVADFKESTYEVYGHGGIGFVIDILSDNNNRSDSSFSHIVEILTAPPVGIPEDSDPHDHISSPRS